jgi:hypothetical protein
LAGSPNPIVWLPLSSPSPSDAIKTGPIYLPVDRKSQGLIMLMSANVFNQNIVLVGAPDEDMAAPNETIRRHHRVPQRQGRSVVADAAQRAGDRQTIQTRYLQPSASCAKPGATCVLHRGNAANEVRVARHDPLLPYLHQAWPT